MDVTKKLASAAGALLGTSLVQGGEFEGWDIDTALLYYQEAEGRVGAIEPTADIHKEFAGGASASVKLVLDALTGATPNGAAPQTTPQTFTRPSGDGTYDVPAGEIPLDDTFHDTRVALSGAWSQPLNERTRAVFGLNASSEYDFFSVGASASLARDYNQKNTTLSIGFSGEFDTLNPVGGVPVAFGEMEDRLRAGSSETKSVMDFLVGVTQVINRRTIAQVNYSLGQSQGYMNDPYKFLTQVDPVTGDRAAIVYENRPDARLKQSLYGLVRHHLSRDVVSGSYRYFMDDWGVSAHTVEMSYRWQMTPRRHLEPSFRFHQQSAADFYRTFLLDGQALPQEASADYRLAGFQGLTAGLAFGWDVRDDSRWLLRFNYYTQKGDSHPADAVGSLQTLDLYPDTRATIVQIQYSF